MSQAISRYITFTIGEQDRKRLKIMFSTSVNAQILMSIFAVIILESFGLCFLGNEADIPTERIIAAQWVFLCSIISLVINLISSPYNALLVAHEHMKVYAYTSIAEVGLKLAIVYLIIAYEGDRLILLSILTILVSLSMRIFYGWYCSKHFEEAHYKTNVFDRKLLKKLTVFSGWNLLSNGAFFCDTRS